MNFAGHPAITSNAFVEYLTNEKAPTDVAYSSVTPGKTDDLLPIIVCFFKIISPFVIFLYCYDIIGLVI